jgi:serine/threonine protein kinase
MTPHRWEQLEELFGEALVQDPARRAEFVSQCQDAELRSELNRLLLEHDRLSVFLEEPIVRLAPDDTQTLTRNVLGPGELVQERYRVVRLVGRGGMGEVYEAEDLELHCRIALKTLRGAPPAAGRLLERFKREVVLGRRITHPNVCRIFDLGRARLGENGKFSF